MKLLRVISTADPASGGPIEGIRQVTKELSKQGHHTEVVTVDDPAAAWLQTYDFEIHALGPATQKYWYSPLLMSWLKSNAPRFDLVVQHGLWNYTSFTTWRAMRRIDVPYVAYSHGMLDPWFRQTYPIKHLAKQLVWWLADGNLIRDASALLFTSEEERVLARNAFWPYKCIEIVVPYGTSDISGDADAQLRAFQEKIPNLKRRPYLLYLSRIHPKKGCDLMIRAFSEFADQHPDLDLVVAGPDQVGWRAELQEIVKQAGLEARVHWPGMLSGDAKWGAFRGCEAFILPSHQENFGIVVAEAMAAGKPLLLTNKVNIWREVVECGGGIVAPDDQAGVTSLMSQFLALSEGERTLMANNSRNGFLQKFEIGKASYSLMTILENITTRRAIN